MKQNEFEKLKIGDKVRIVPLERLRKCRGVVQSMEKLAGKIVTINCIGWIEESWVEIKEDRQEYLVRFKWHIDTLDCKVSSEIINGKNYHCKTEEIAKAFLKQAEKQGCLWSSRNKPTSHTNWQDYKENTVYFIGNYYPNELTFADVNWAIEEGKEVIEYIPYETNHKCKEKIVITTDGKTTTAKLFKGKKLIKTAEAKCNPANTFDFGIGARIALDRLSGREKVAEKKDNKPFVIGERIQFKTWEELVKKFGIIDNHIGTSATFIRDMSHLCGTYATVDAINEYRLLLKDFSAKGDTSWWYTTEMIKHIDRTGGKR